MSITVKVTPDMVSALESVQELVRNTVFSYSEWLDAAGLMATPDVADKRTHDDLVSEFIGTDTPKLWTTRRSRSGS